MSIIMKIFRSNVAEVGTPTAGDIAKTSMTVTGQVGWYKDGATWGVAYKKHSASSWSHKASSSQSISETITSLTANTKYDIKLYVRFNGEYQYGPEINATTLAE